METEIGGTARDFPPTRWTLIRSAAQDPEARRKAMDGILEQSWKPLYHFARRKGLSIEDAKDAIQGFATQLLQRDFLERLDPAKGTLRSYLVGSLGHYLVNRHERASAQKRGGGAPVASIDIDVAEKMLAGAPNDPAKAYEREWATGVMERAIGRLRKEFSSGDRSGPFELVEQFLGFGEAPSYSEAASTHDMSVPKLKAFLHRARTRFRDLVREEVLETVDHPDEVDLEISRLLEALAS